MSAAGNVQSWACWRKESSGRKRRSGETQQCCYKTDILFRVHLEFQINPMRIQVKQPHRNQNRQVLHSSVFNKFIFVRKGSKLRESAPN